MRALCVPERKRLAFSDDASSRAPDPDPQPHTSESRVHRSTDGSRGALTNSVSRTKHEVNSTICACTLCLHKQEFQSLFSLENTSHRPKHCPRRPPGIQKHKNAKKKP
jgi:hypothetical protein